MADRFGKTFTWELKVKQMGLASMELATLIVSEMNLPLSASEYLVQVGAIHQTLFPKARLLPGNCI